MKNLLTILILLYTSTIYAQDTESEIKSVDSLRYIAHSSNSDSIIFDCYFKIGQLSNTTDTVKKYSNLALNYYDKIPINNDSIKFQLYQLLGWAYYYSDDNDSSSIFYKKALEIGRKTNNQRFILKASLKIANCYSENNTNVDEKWLTYYSIYESAIQIDDKFAIIYSNRLLGEEFYQLGLYKSAYFHFYNNEQICIETNDSLNLAITYADIASAIIQQFSDYKDTIVIINKLKIAEYYANKAYSFLTKLKSNDFYILTFIKNCEEIYRNIYLINYQLYKDIKYLNLSQKYCKILIDWGKHIGDNSLLTISYLNNAEIYFTDNKFKKGKTELDKVKKILEKGYNINKEKYFDLLITYYTHNEDYKNASMLKDSLIKLKEDKTINSSLIEEIKSQSDIRLKVIRQNNDKELEHNKAKYIAENKYNTKLNLFLTTGIIILSILSFIIVILYILRQKAAREVSKRKEELEQKAKQIHSSIVYAERIQKAALQPVGFVKSIFNDCFVYYNPKDIVSGDFYMVSQNGNYKLMIVADCTGHGVPGGFLSMLGISALKEIITQYQDYNPGKILNDMRTFVKTTLNNSHNIGDKTKSSQKLMMAEGMDMIVCSYNTQQKTFAFAAANLSVYVCRNGIITRYKGDSMPVGCYILEKENFTTKQIDIEERDMIYLPTDGFQEQIGGEEQKRYSINKMQNFFASIYNKDVDIQNKLIGDEVQQWIKTYYQLDDMTIVGIRI